MNCKAILVCCLLSLPVHAELLFENFGCNENPTTADYQARLEPLKQAFRTGREVRIYMRLEHPDGTTDEYFTALTAGRFDEDVVYALLPMRPAINGHAQVTRPDAVMVGGVNSLGMYWYGIQAMGAKRAKMAQATCFDIRWFAN